MHNVVRLPEQRHLGPDQLTTEMEVLAAARNVASRIAQMRGDGGNATLSHRSMEWVAQAGLLAISIPDEFGGPDVTNATIAEVVALLAEADLAVGEYIKAHYRVLEALRLGGSYEQKNIFFAHARAGEHFYLPFSDEFWDASTADGTVITSDRTGYQLTCEVSEIVVSSSDWIVIPARDNRARKVLVFLDRASQNSVVSRSDADALPDGSPRTILEQFHVPADAAIPFDVAPNTSYSTLHSLSRVLDAAADLGIARCFFAELCLDLSAGGSNSGAATAGAFTCDLDLRIGRLSAHIQGASAAVERAGQHLDIAQVDTSEQSAQHACLSTSAALVLSRDVALDVLAAFIEIVNPTMTHEVHQTWRSLMDNRLVPPSLAHLGRQALAHR